MSILPMALLSLISNVAHVFLSTTAAFADELQTRTWAQTPASAVGNLRLAAWALHLS